MQLKVQLRFRFKQTTAAAVTELFLLPIQYNLGHKIAAGNSDDHLHLIIQKNAHIGGVSD